MEKNTLILGQDQYYSLDCHNTKLNNNVLIIGASGSGKTRNYVIPNLLQATGSYVVSDPKGNLYQRYRLYMESQGYTVKILDFTAPENSAHYNFFKYITNTQDIVKVAHMLIYQHEGRGNDPFWDEASQILVQSLMAYLIETCPMEERNLHNILKLLELCQVDGEFENEQSILDRMMEQHANKNPDSYAVHTYRKVRVAANRTLRSILVSVNARLGLFDTKELNSMMSDDNIAISSIGQRKTVLFVVVSDTERSLDTLINVFFSQAMNELCRHADKKCKDYCLPVPVRFMLDDFATNCIILEFPRMISSIRSRRISAMLMIQAESQLTQYYGYGGRTVIANCDTYVYLGGNDIETAKAVAERCDVPLKKILNMPMGTIWIFRRGQAPINAKIFELEPFLAEKKLN